MFLSITFQDWANAIFTPFSYFVDWLSMVANALLDNYIVITLLCITLIFSIFYFFIFRFINYVNNFDERISNKTTENYLYLEQRKDKKTKIVK